MFKKTKLHAAISLVIQSMAMTALFFIFWAQKKSIARAFLAVAAIEGSAAAYLLYKIKKEKEETFDPGDVLDEDALNLDIDEGDITSCLSRVDEDNATPKSKVEIPKEDVVSDAEFDTGV
ncbi:MAG: hypothetical protein SOZ62_00860 [Eubacteriales bacterium]|nr:hypothetical protein [Eubacteriales bacterium]